MTGKEGRMTSEEGKEGFRCQVSGRKGIGQREKGMGQGAESIGHSAWGRGERAYGRD